MSGFRNQLVQGEGERTSTFRQGLESNVIVSTPVGMVDSQRNLDFTSAVNEEAGSTGFSLIGVRDDLAVRRSQRNRKPPDYVVNKELTLINTMFHFRVGSLV